MAAPPRIPDFDILAALGVTADDPPETVKAAWRRAVKEHHPDAAGGSDERIKRINIAYEWLRDPTLRQTYLAATAGWGIARPQWDAQAAWPAADEEPVPEPGPYAGPRADRIESIVDRIAEATMAELLDIVHGFRPDLRWSLALARGIEVSGRRADGASAVWQVRRSVRERIEVLLESEAVRATYDDELVGQVVSDRLADLVRAIVLLDVLTPDARTRLATEWNAVMGPRADPPGDEGVLPAPTGTGASVRAGWARLPVGGRWLAVLVLAAVYATAVNLLLPSREALAVIILGYAAAGVVFAMNRRPAA